MNQEYLDIKKIIPPTQIIKGLYGDDFIKNRVTIKVCLPNPRDAYTLINVTREQARDPEIFKTIANHFAQMAEQISKGNYIHNLDTP